MGTKYQDEIDAKVYRWAEQLKTGFRPFFIKHVPQILEAYIQECEECAMCLPKKEQEAFLKEAHDNMKKVLGVI